MKVLQLVNRTKTKIEFMYDSVLYTVPGAGQLLCADHVAWHGFNKNIAQLDPITGEALFLLGVRDDQGRELRNCEPLDYERKKNEELLDRSNMEGQFKTVTFSNPDAQKARVQPVQMSGSFTDQAGEQKPALAFASELRAPDADGGSEDGEK